MKQSGMFTKKDTCYIQGVNGREYTCRDFYERNGYEILEWSDYMGTEKQEFTKSDLKYGYMVKLRNGEKALYMPSEMGDSFDWCDNMHCLAEDEYDENLIFKNGIYKKQYDVIEVYGLSKTRFTTTLLSEEERELVWKREEKPVLKMTVEEMKQKLSEIMNAEIVEQQ